MAKKCVMVEAENNDNPHLRPSHLKIVVITITIIIINNKNSSSSNSDHPVFFFIAVPNVGKYENKNKTNIETPKLFRLNQISANFLSQTIFGAKLKKDIIATTQMIAEVTKPIFSLINLN